MNRHEMRVTRVLYYFFFGKYAVLTNGFVKKTQKMPPREIDLAKMIAMISCKGKESDNERLQ